MAKPDLGAMALPKAKAVATSAFSEPAPTVQTAPPVAAVPETGSPLSPKSLTIKLDGPLYAALRGYCHTMEMERGKRVTHQEVMVQALQRLLAQG